MRDRIEGRSHRKRDKRYVPVMTFFFFLFTGVMIALAVWGPEQLARYQDQVILDAIHIEPVDLEGEGYRYALSSREKLYILSEALSSYLSRNEAAEQEYGQVTGAYAFIENYRGPYEKQITGDGVYDSCNIELAHLKELLILPDEVGEVDKDGYTASLYSAIDVLEPRNNVAVWKVSFLDIQKNISRKNKLMDACIDADNGKIYEFYVRTEWQWEDIDPDAMINAWSRYMELPEPVEYEAANPMLETTPYFKKYSYAGTGEEETIVTIGYYEGIQELFLKISQ